MDTIRQSWNRLTARLRDHAAWVGPASVAAVIVTLTVAIGVIAVQQQTPTKRVSLLGERRVSETQLATMVGALAQAELQDFEIRNGQILVPAQQTSVCLAALVASKALPPDFHSHTGDAVGESRLFESERDSLRRIEHARERDLAAVFVRMEGIDNAMVQYGETEANDFRQKKIVTASVTIMTAPEHELNRQQVRTIRTTVAAARGMNPDDVCVADLRTGRCYAGSAEEMETLALAEQYLSVQKMLEREWHDKICKLLRFVQGVDVVVNLELPVAWQTAAAVDATPAVALRPQRIAVAIQVPEDFYRSQTEIANATDEISVNTIGAQTSATGQRARTSTHGESSVADSSRRAIIDGQLRAAIAGLFADAPDIKTSIQIVKVSNVTAAPVVAVEKSFWNTAWQEHQFAWMIVFVSGLFVAVFPTVRRHVFGGAHVPQTLPIQPESADDTSVRASETDRTEIETEQLRGTLTEMVRDDPDGAAQVLHRWLDRAG